MSAPTRERWSLSMGPDREPTRSETVQHAHGDRSDPHRTVFPRAGHVLGTGLAVLYGRTTTSAAELRASAAAALAMADMLDDTTTEGGH